jgi:hypothetical protein
MKTLAVNLLLSCAVVLAQQGSKKQTPREQRVGLIELEATSRIVDGPIREGSYDDSFRIKRASYYAPSLLDCSDRVADAAKQWAKIQGATIIKSDREPHRVLVHFLEPKTPGFYELLYRIDLTIGTARVTFFHILKGDSIVPEAEPQSGADKLAPMLQEALTCVQPSSSSH